MGPCNTCAEELSDRIAGFVIFGHDNQGEQQQQQQFGGAGANPSPLSVARTATGAAAAASPARSIRIIYVEKCGCDFEALDDKQKFALLEDRALIVHRLVDNCCSAPAAGEAGNSNKKKSPL
jgi:hypothetical protein